MANFLISAGSSPGTVVQLEAEWTTEMLYPGKGSRVMRSKLLRTKKLGRLLVGKMRSRKVLESFQCEKRSVSSTVVLSVM